MDGLTLFGVVTLAAMLVFYALEDRSPIFLLLFALTCVASAAYGFLQGAWPFGVIETIWTGVALQRWRARISSGKRGTARPIACDMTALSGAERERYGVLRRQVVSAIDQVSESIDAYQLRLNGSIAARDVAEWMSMEHRCCPFLALDLALKDDGTTWLSIGGSERIKAFVAEEFQSFAGA